MNQSEGQMAIQELAPRETTPMQVPDTMMILQSAVQHGADITTIERLVALQEKMLAREAVIEFNDALFRVQSALATIRTDMENSSTRSKYASYAQLDRAVRPFYSRERMSLSFDTEESPKGVDYVRVLCYVSRGAHTRTYRYDIPADGKGAKGNDVMSKTHATGAAGSYGMRYLLKMIFNLSIGEDETDGNSMGELTELLNKIGTSPTEDDLRSLFDAAVAKFASNKDATLAIVAAKDKRKAELRRGNRQ